LLEPLKDRARLAAELPDDELPDDIFADERDEELPREELAWLLLDCEEPPPPPLERADERPLPLLFPLPFCAIASDATNEVANTPPNKMRSQICLVNMIICLPRARLGP
jgi:hypothetical protein